MADDQNDTSTSETDALLADLERRASSGESKATSSDSGGDDEDLEAFLASLEGEDDDVDAPSAESAGPDPLAAEFAELEKTAPPAPEPDPASDDEATEKTKDKEKKKVKTVEKGESDGLKKVAAIMRWGFYVIPTCVAIWLLGAALSHWVSAAWLVLIISFATVFGLSAALRLGIKKGSYGIWLGSLATLVSVGLLAGATEWSGSALAKFGHWPTSAVAEAAGWSPDHGAVSANAWVGEVVGNQLSELRNAEPDQAYRLGGQLLLSGEDPKAASVDKTDTTKEPEETNPPGGDDPDTKESDDKPADKEVEPSETIEPSEEKPSDVNKKEADEKSTADQKKDPQADTAEPPPNDDSEAQGEEKPDSETSPEAADQPEEASAAKP